MKPKYIALVIQYCSKSSVILWASAVNNPDLVYRAEFDFSPETAISILLRALENILIEVRKTDPGDHFDFVLYQNDELTVMFSRYADELANVNWIDFLSFYAGTKGVCVNEARTTLGQFEKISSGPKKCTMLASLFADILGVSKAQQQVIAGAQKMSAAAGAFFGE